MCLRPPLPAICCGRMVWPHAELPSRSDAPFHTHQPAHYCIDTGMYVGSCTMKLTPRFTKEVARLPGFGRRAPAARSVAFASALRLMSSYRSCWARSRVSSRFRFRRRPARRANSWCAGVSRLPPDRGALSAPRFWCRRGPRHQPRHRRHGWLQGGRDQERQQGQCRLDDLKSKLSPRTAGMMLDQP